VPGKRLITTPDHIGRHRATPDHTGPPATTPDPQNHTLVPIVTLSYLNVTKKRWNWLQGEQTAAPTDASRHVKASNETGFFNPNFVQSSPNQMLNRTETLRNAFE